MIRSIGFPLPIQSLIKESELETFGDGLSSLFMILVKCSCDTPTTDERAYLKVLQIEYEDNRPENQIG